MNKKDDIWNYSNPLIVQANAKKYFRDDTDVYISTRADKKYMIFNPQTNKWVHFGAMGFQDFTYDNKKDIKKQKRYLARATKIKGNWKDDKYSPNNLAINLLWS